MVTYADAMSSPTVLIIAQNEERTGGDQLSGAPLPLLHSVMAAKGIPLICPNGLPENDVRKILRSVDSVLLAGGQDILPGRYRQKLSTTVKIDTCDSARDETEIFAVRYCVASKKPVLGICRGHQVMNVAMGGDLIQDLSIAGMPGHEYINRSSWTKLKHSLTIAPSLLSAALKLNEIECNTAHHQGLGKIGAGLTITSFCKDSCPEALELQTHPFFVGVQCHPETLWQTTEKPWLNLFKRLVTTAHKLKLSRSL